MEVDNKPYHLVEVTNDEGGMGWWEFPGNTWATADEAFAALQDAYNENYIHHVEYEKLSDLARWYRRRTGDVIVYNEELS